MLLIIYFSLFYQFFLSSLIAPLSHTDFWSLFYCNVMIIVVINIIIVMIIII